jgi:hypothetical protein
VEALHQFRDRRKAIPRNRHLWLEEERSPLNGRKP